MARITGVRSKLAVKALRKFLKKSQKNFGILAKPVIGKAIDRNIEAGISPVKGGGRFKKYSDSYKDQIEENEGIIMGSDGNLNIGKRPRPVNLFVSGKARKSLKVKRTAKGVTVKYKSKIMGFHNAGAGSLPRRAVIPKDGEKFTRKITKLLKFLAIKSVAKAKKR